MTAYQEDAYLRGWEDGCVAYEARHDTPNGYDQHFADLNRFRKTHLDPYDCGYEAAYEHCQCLDLE